MNISVQNAAMSMQAHAQSFQIACEVKFDADLPNGPYGSVTGMTMAIHVPPTCSYQTVKEAMLKAWVVSRGTMMNTTTLTMDGMTGTYSENWDILELKYKGGAVDMAATASEGTHNVSLRIQQTVGSKATGCCVVL